MKQRELELKRLTTHCGAEVHGIDLSQTLDVQTVEMLTSALAEHCVLFFRDQQMTPVQQKELGRRFGELHVHPVWPRLVEGHPEIMEILSDEHTVRIAGEEWHSDVSCDAEPPMGTILQMLEVPPTGGDTLFASMYLAYETLSNGMKQLLGGLRAEHSSRHVFGYDRYDHVSEYEGRIGNPQFALQDACHPVVITHPETGRKALYVNPGFTVGIEGWHHEESDALLGYLYAHAVRPEFTCRFRWEPGSVALWDNRSTWH